jgi:hypothetical protein
MFMRSHADDNNNMTGYTDEQYLAKLTGYGLTCDRGNPQFVLVAYLGNLTTGSPIQIIATSYNLPVVGQHHIDITRDEFGQIYVFLDEDHENPILEAKDDRVTTSKQFSYTTFRGPSRIDNISVSDSVDIPYTPLTTTTTTTTTPTTTTTTTTTTTVTPAPGFTIVSLLFSSLLIGIVTFRKRRR